MPTGRYAPSPTGTFHLGNLRTAMAAWLIARSTGSDFLLRWEDLDPNASAEHEASQTADLVALGIDFDGPALRQSLQDETYRDALADLNRAGLTYPCWCSRREVREAAAPHDPPGKYPGTCRRLDAASRQTRERSDRPPATRLRADGAPVSIHDELNGPVSAVVDDIVVSRIDGLPAYHLAVVVDDAQQGVEEVVRGDDLLPHTPAHALLQRFLGLAEPRWCHVPLVLDEDEQRLAKRDGSLSRTEWLDESANPSRLLAELGRSLGVRADQPTSAADLLPGFDLSRLPRHAWVAPGPGVPLHPAGSPTA